jgi:hypothetical protein
VLTGWRAKWSVDFSGPPEERPRIQDPRRPHPFIIERMHGSALRGDTHTHLQIQCVGRDLDESGIPVTEPEEFYLNGWAFDSLPVEVQCAIEDAVARARVVADYIASRESVE